MAQASEESASTAQWRARGVAAVKASRPAIESAFATQPAAPRAARAGLQWTSSRIPGAKSRALSEAIRTVQHEEPALPPASRLQTPASEAADTAPATTEPTEPAAAPEATTEAPAAESAAQTKAQPALLDDTQPTDAPTMPADDPFKGEPDAKRAEDADNLFKNDPIPTPPDSQLPTPSGDLGEGIETPPGGAGCKGYDKECVRALEELQKRDITTIFVGVVIEGTEGEDFPCDCKLGRDFQAPQFAARNFAPTLFTWKASGTCHKPLYFEDVQLERYGHSWNPVLQPFVSGAHFFVSVPLLPYKMGLNPPHECMYTLGYYRPGNCAPYMFEPIPLSLRAAVFEGFGAAAFAFWFWPPN
jgi:hypothetical protein